MASASATSRSNSFCLAIRPSVLYPDRSVQIILGGLCQCALVEEKAFRDPSVSQLRIAFATAALASILGAEPISASADPKLTAARASVTSGTTLNPTSTSAAIRHGCSARAGVE